MWSGVEAWPPNFLGPFPADDGADVMYFKACEPCGSMVRREGTARLLFECYGVTMGPTKM